jgi:hypothetical protein
LLFSATVVFDDGAPAFISQFASLRPGFSPFESNAETKADSM